MKTYRVLIEPPALAQIAHYYERAVQADAKVSADRWFLRLQAVILGLATMPARGVAVPEQPAFAIPLLQVIFERRYRVIFTIRGDAVHILCVRGIGLPPLQPGDIADTAHRGRQA